MSNRIKKCPYCEKDFTIKRSNQKYCSHDCFGKYIDGRGIKNHIKNGKECIKCKKDLTDRQKKFCSTKCSISYQNKRCRTKCNENRKNRFKILKKQLVQACGGSCLLCGYDKCDQALVFHHLDESTKEIRLDTTSLSSSTKETILQELPKCVVLCHNCHFEVHFLNVEIPKQKDIDYSYIDESLFRIRHTGSKKIINKYKKVTIGYEI